MSLALSKEQQFIIISRLKKKFSLCCFREKYNLWADELISITDNHERMIVNEIAHELAYSLERRQRMLKFFSMNHFDMEANSRLENLTEFKAAYGKSINAVEKCLEKFYPNMSKKDRQDFIYSLYISEKQRKAMRAASINYVYISIYEITYTCAKKLL